MIVLKGNDVTLEWTIFKCLDGAEIPEDFGEADLKVSLVYRGRQIPTEYSALGNLISVAIPGDKQPLGVVGIEAIWSKSNPPKWSRMLESNAVEFTNIPEKAEQSCQIGEGENVVIKAKSILHGSVGYDGITPHIGENGNWFIGQTDTGHSSKGDAFLFEDFTPQQIEVLQRPAKDAAESVSSLESTISSNEQARVINEKRRIDSETDRDLKEEERLSSEIKRVLDENIRLDAEVQRSQDEAIRIDSETARAASENLRNNNEAARDNSETLRNSSERDRGGQELARVESEKLRVIAENKRSTDTGTAIMNCETATDNADLKAIYAEEQGDYAKSIGDSLPEFIPLTQAEYDALPDSKLTDGNYYIIV